MVIHINKHSNPVCLPESMSPIMLGFGWDIIESRPEVDMELCVACLTEKSKLLTNQWLIFGSILTSPGNIINHYGDSFVEYNNNEEDKESLEIDLAKIPVQIVKIVLYANICGCKRTFQEVSRVHLRFINKKTKQDTHIIDIHEFPPNVECLVVAELNRNESGKWEINPVCWGIPSQQMLIESICV